MPTELDLAAERAARRVLGELLASGHPYTALPLVDPDTGLLPPPTVDAIREPLEGALTDIDETLDGVETTLGAQASKVGELEQLTATGRLSPTELNATIVEVGYSHFARPIDLAASYARGAVVFTWDDGYSNWQTVAEMAAERQQRHTFCVTQSRIGTTISLAALEAIRDLNAGHEFAAHSKTHANLTQLTAAQRADEYDATWLEAISGQPVTTFAYPYGTANNPTGRNVTTDGELYLRYGRLLDTTGESMVAVVPRFTPPFVVPRVGWNNNAKSTGTIKKLIQLAASSPVTVFIYAHDPAGLISGGYLADVMDHAFELGVPCVTAAEAVPAYPATILDPGFEDATLGPWAISATSPNTVQSVVDAPQVGLGGTRSLRIHQESTTGQTFASQLLRMEPGVAYRVNYKGRVVVRNQGSGARYSPIAQVLDENFNVLSSPTAAASITSSSWASGTFDIPAHASARWCKLFFVIQNSDADFYVDHVQYDRASTPALA